MEQPPKHKLYVSLHEGIGNQLFQFAVGYALAKKHNLELVLNHITKLIRHNKHEDEFTGTFFRGVPLVSNYRPPNANVFLERVDQYYNHIPDIIKDPNADHWLHGFFQNETYFAEHASELRARLVDPALCARVLERIPILRDDHTFFIHVRRGDYLTFAHHHVDLRDYYKQAVAYIVSKSGDASPQFLITSDDIEFCESDSFFSGLPNACFLHVRDARATLHIMAMCKGGGICANSTFSWWGAYLNCNENKIVTFPKKWLNAPELSVDIYFKGSVVI